MKKGKISMTITIGIVCFLLVMIIFMQFKVVQESQDSNIDSMQEAELRQELANWKTKYEETKAKSEETANTLQTYREETTSDEKTKETLETELENLNMQLGKTDVEGEGIVIQLTDKAGTQLEDGGVVNSIDASELLTIVNELFTAGAEAISINGNRIISMSAIYAIGNEFLKIDGEKISSPYVINAIGNPDYLKSAVSGKGGGVDYLKELGHDTRVDTSKRIRIDKYDKDITTKYIN